MYMLDMNICIYDAEVRSGLEAKGTPIGNMDLLIAAHARSGDCTLVSNNLGEFRRIPRLSAKTGQPEGIPSISSSPTPTCG